jgi:hypothetical protein
LPLRFDQKFASWIQTWQYPAHDHGQNLPECAELWQELAESAKSSHQGQAQHLEQGKKRPYACLRLTPKY